MRSRVTTLPASSDANAFQSDGLDHSRLPFSCSTGVDGTPDSL